MPRQSHRRRIYETLRDRVQRGEIARGDKLVDTVVAEEFGVSRMPVRDALMQLTHEGYLESTSRGFTLPNLSEAKILEVFLLRRLLEPYAAASATLAMTEMDIGRMQEAVADTTATLTNGDIGLMYRASEVFRNVWTGAIPNEELRQTILRYMAQIQTVRVATLSESASHKVEGHQYSRHFVARDRIKNHGRTLCRARSDNGPEFIAQKVQYSRHFATAMRLRSRIA